MSFAITCFCGSSSTGCAFVWVWGEPEAWVCRTLPWLEAVRCGAGDCQCPVHLKAVSRVMLFFKTTCWPAIVAGVGAPGVSEGTWREMRQIREGCAVKGPGDRPAHIFDDGGLFPAFPLAGLSISPCGHPFGCLTLPRSSAAWCFGSLTPEHERAKQKKHKKKLRTRRHF